MYSSIMIIIIDKPITMSWIEFPRASVNLKMKSMFRFSYTKGWCTHYWGGIGTRFARMGEPPVVRMRAIVASPC